MRYLALMRAVRRFSRIEPCYPPQVITTTGRIRSSCVGTLLGLFLGFAARTGAAEGVHIVTPSGEQPLIAGQLVQVGWDPLPEGVEEMELLLYMEGGSVQTVRLTPQLLGDTRTYRWRVPNLPAREVRLRLRWGCDGVEREGEPSPPYTIIADSKSPVESIRLRLGEWWVDDPFSFLGRCCGDQSQSLQSRADRALECAMSVVTEVPHDETGSRQEIPPRRSVRYACAPSLDPRIAARCPLTIPLRT